MMKSKFPHIHNSGEAIYQDGNVTFSWFNSLGQSITETLKILPAKRIAALMVARLGRFQSAGPGSREGEHSRAERKYISAHSEKVLREAWELLDDAGQMEMAMALDMNSHHGISDPDWMEKHRSRRENIVGDDKKPLNGN